jgi:hypothetical protein
MSLASWFYGKIYSFIYPVRDYIAHDTIRVGTILTVYPAERSHVSKPYKVKVVHLCKEYFKTCMLEGTGRIATFYFDSDVWKDYHHCRFKIYVF